MKRVETMLVSELADRAEVPLATVKYYLREGLLPPGETVGPRRAEYDEAHLRRLRVLRALREVGGAPVSTLQVIVDAIEDAARPSHEVLCEISDALSPPLPDEEERPDTELGGCVDAAIEAVGWSGIRHDAAARSRLAAVVQLGGAELLTVNPEILGYYAHLADELCRTEVSLVDPTKDRQGTLEDMVVGEAVFGEILALFRRLGHEHYDEQRAREGTV
jgi:DNA-binding transcriptional MerR regulator